MIMKYVSHVAQLRFLQRSTKTLKKQTFLFIIMFSIAKAQLRFIYSFCQLRSYKKSVSLSANLLVGLRLPERLIR